MLAMRSIIIFPLLGIALLAQSASAQDLKVIQLQQDVRDLQQEVQQQSRRIDALERELAQARASSASVGSAKPAGGAKTPTADASRAWLTIANWDRVHTGTTELDVIAALGPPTAIRKSADGARQTLLYSLEIAAGGFLVGQVVLSDHRVIEVLKPMLQ
ncbi:MAG TPA: hypothetical protein VET48_02545 [Steroidobacteraceae bacterium]|nr:hypothetical protein [Steroidobacteraceae bacterium]